VSTSTAEVWHHVREVRLDVADRVEGFDEEQEVVPVLDLYRRIGRVAFARTPRGVRLVATDATWQSGDGPEVEGRAIDLLLVLAGRPGALDELTGPGVAELRRRWQLGPVVDPPG
jgi:hypothetical protein